MRDESVIGVSLSKGDKPVALTVSLSPGGYLLPGLPKGAARLRALGILVDRLGSCRVALQHCTDVAIVRVKGTLGRRA